MPFPLKSATALGGLLGATQSDQAEAGFIGPKGFNRLFRAGSVNNSYNVAVREAERLEAAGHSPQEIFERVQVVRNPALDNRWVGAISDINAKYAEPYDLANLVGGMYRAQDVYKHPELYRAYPEFKKMPITLGSLENVGGAYNSYVRPVLGGPPGHIEVHGVDRPQIETVLAHEVGHATGDKPIENWPVGGNPETAKTVWTDYAGPAVADLFARGEKDKAFDLLKRWGSVQVGSDYDAYTSLGGEVLSRQNEHLLNYERSFPNEPFSSNVANAAYIYPDKPSGYILPEHATGRFMQPDLSPMPLDKLSDYEILAKAYHETKSVADRQRIKQLLDQYAPRLRQIYGSTPDEFLARFAPAQTNKANKVVAGSAAALGGVLGVTLPKDTEANPIGIKRWPLLYHGIKGEPESAWEAKDAILYEGLTKGESAELQLPGTSVSKDPWVSNRLFTGVDPNIQRGEEFGPNKEYMLAVEPQIPPSQAQNLSPARYLTGTVPENAAIYGKPNYWQREAELFAMRHPAPVRRELSMQEAFADPEIAEWIKLDKEYTNTQKKYNFNRNHPKVQAALQKVEDYSKAHPYLDTGQIYALTTYKKATTDPQLAKFMGWNGIEKEPVYTEFDWSHPLANKQTLVKARELGTAEDKDIDDMIRADEAYGKVITDINEYKPSQISSELGNYQKKQLLKNWMGSLNAIRGREGLFEQRFGRELIGNERGRYGTPALAPGQTDNTIRRYQDNIWNLLKDTLSPYEYAQVQVKLKDLKETRYTLDQYANEHGKARKELYDAMHSGDPERIKIAEKDLTVKYNTYYEKRDKFFNFLNDKIGGASVSPRFTKLPAAGVAGGGYYTGGYNIGEAKPTNAFQEAWQTNPIGQAATGLMQSSAETGAAIIDETQQMGSEFYSLPKQETGTKILRYLETEGAIPRRTGSTWETLGGLLGL